jgi:hypothetical protein
MVKRVFAILMWVLLFFFLTLFLVGACAGLFLGGFYLIGSSDFLMGKRG